MSKTAFQRYFQYPCAYCGECSIWLMAFDCDELDTIDKVINECAKKKCPVLGTYVKREEVEATSMQERYDKYYEEWQKELLKREENKNGN